MISVTSFSYRIIPDITYTLITIFCIKSYENFVKFIGSLELILLYIIRTSKFFSLLFLGIFKVIEDLNYVVLLRKKFGYIESIPGVLLPHPSSTAYPFKVDGYSTPEAWHFQGTSTTTVAPSGAEFFDQYNLPLKITPSMSSLEALLSKLPSVVPPTTPSQQPVQFMPCLRPLEFMGIEKVAKEEIDEEIYRPEHDVGESSSSAYRRQQHFHQNQHDENVTSSGLNNGF